MSCKTGSTFLVNHWNKEVTLCSAASEGPWGHSLYTLIDQLRKAVLWRKQRKPRHTLPQVRHTLFHLSTCCLSYISTSALYNMYLNVIYNNVLLQIESAVKSPEFGVHFQKCAQVLPSISVSLLHSFDVSCRVLSFALFFLGAICCSLSSPHLYVILPLS